MNLRSQAGRLALLEGLFPPLVAFGLTFLVLGLMMQIIGISPLKAFQALFSGAFGSQYAVGLTLVNGAPLILTGLSVCFAFRTGLFNIGAEGQLQLGALFAFVVGMATGNLFLAFLAAFVGGAFWGGIAGGLKVWRGANEIISTIMLNFVGIDLVKNLILGPLGDPNASHPTTVRLPQSTWFPIIVPETSLHLGFLIAVATGVAVYLFFRNTTLGFRLVAVGESPEAARHAGINANVCRLLALLIAGGIAGLAGAGELLGVQRRLGLDWSRGWGITGLAVSFLAGNHPLGVIVVGLFFGVLDAGSTQMQAATGLPAALVKLVQGLPVVFLVAVTSWQQIRARGHARKAVAEG